MRILLIDDSEVVRERLAALLTDLLNVDIVATAQNALEGVDSIRRFRPDAVILDIRMPVGTGIDVLNNIKRDSNAPIVIVLTNYPFAGYRQRCLNAGADFFLDKSTEFDQIPKLFERFKQEWGSN